MIAETPRNRLVTHLGGRRPAEPPSGSRRLLLEVDIPRRRQTALQSDTRAVSFRECAGLAYVLQAEL